MVEEFQAGVVLHPEAADAVELLIDDDGGGVPDAALVEVLAQDVGDVLSLSTLQVGIEMRDKERLMSLFLAHLQHDLSD